MPGDVQRLKRLVEPHPATLRDDKDLYGMQEVRGSNPLSSTVQGNISNSCALAILVPGSKPGWKPPQNPGLAIVLHRLWPT
jgi:hypothetical protein